MTAPPDLTPGLIAAHAAGLRALARNLLSDPHAAEDAVQDTWAIALERPPANDASIGSWLRAVLRSVISNRRRSEANRIARERAVARPEESDEHARSVRTVIDAVLALDEPYRATVLARYFQGLMPREIAQRDGVPIHTVESRLQRALARLRTKLASDFDECPAGGRRALALLAFPSAKATSSAATSVGFKIAAAATLVIGVTWLAWPRDEESAQIAKPNPEIADAPAQDSSTRTPIAAPTVEVAQPDPPRASRAQMPTLPTHELRFSMLVTTPEGIPLRGAAVLAAPSDTCLNDVASTNADGTAEVRLRTTLPEVDLIVAAWHPRVGRSGPWRMKVRANSPLSIHLGLDDAALPSLDAQAAIGHHHGDLRDAGDAPGSVALLAFLHAPAAGRVAGRVQLGRRGFEPRMRAQHAWMYDGHAIGGRGFGMSHAGSLVGAGEDVDQRSYSVLDSDPVVGQTARITGCVLDERGVAVAGALVVADSEYDGARSLGEAAVDGALRRTRTDERGEFTIDALRSGVWRVVAAATGRGSTTRSLQAAQGSTTTWVARLEPGITYTGRFEFLNVPPLRCEWITVDPNRLDVRGVLADSGGSFCFAELPAGTAALVTVPSGASALPSLVASNLEPRAPPTLYTPGTFARGLGEARLHVLDPEADSREEFLRRNGALQVRVTTRWGFGVERCTWMDVDERTGGFHCTGLAPGRYTVDVGSEFAGWVAPIELEVGADATTDLGDIALPLTGHVNVRRTPSSKAGRWLVRRGAAEIVLTTLEANSASEFGGRVPPGEYLLFDPLDRARGFAFEVAAGEVVTVDDDGVLQRTRH